VTEGVLDSLLVIFKDNQAQHDLVYWGLVVFQQLVLLCTCPLPSSVLVCY